MMRNGLALAAAICFTIFMLTESLRFLEGHTLPTVVPVVTGQARTLILDAGHGGEDGGAVAPNGTPESRINLAVVLKMDALLGFYGVSPVLLRDTDRSLHHEGAETLREKKVSDLKNRAAAIQQTPNATLVSIHQNSYPDPRYRGSQVFYAPTDNSQPLAQHIQRTLRSGLQPDNTRETKKIPDTVYLMNHVDCPAVLVECGFLTHPEENLLLQDEGYQRKLAAVLAAAWLTAPQG